MLVLFERDSLEERLIRFSDKKGERRVKQLLSLYLAHSRVGCLYMVSQVFIAKPSH